MNLRKILRQSYLTSSLLIAVCIGTAIEPVGAEGSKNLYPSGALGHRGNIVWTDSTSSGFKNRTLLRVYAEAGQYILVGSSAVGVGSGNIEIYNPGKVTGSVGNQTIPTTANADFVCSQQRAALGNNNIGIISTRTQELAGPRSINGTGNTSGYRPCYYQATTTGIYYVAIYGPSGKSGTADATPGATGNITSINTGTNQNTGISAWDVTVRSSISSTTDLTGRLHTYLMSMNLGANGRNLYSTLYPITVDGYRYRIDFKGTDPFGFRIFGNLLGNLDSDGKSPLYKDIIGDNADIANPEGGTSSAPPQFPIFFNQLNESVLSYLQKYDPLTGIESGTGFSATPVTPLVSSVSYSGNVSGNRSTVNNGGTFTFDSNISGVYEIIISRNGVNFDPSVTENKVLRGLITNSGTQTVVWDGLDNSGQPFPVGEFDYQVKIHAGEYHFPMSDAENNVNGGPTYTLLNGTNPLGNTTAFYDHRGYYTVDGILVADRDPSDGNRTDDALCGINPPNPAFTDPVLGADSTNPNFNKFGQSGNTGNANTKCASTGSFGDTKTLDLWTYRPSEPVAQVLEIVELDYGDAPVSYDDTADNNRIIDTNDNPANHAISSSIYLGSVAPDAEIAPQSSPNADGDDNATAPNVDDEDAFTNLPNVNATATATGNYSLNVPVTNTSGGNAKLHGWIDFNKNGKFESGEYQSADVTDTSPVNLTWAVPAGTTPGNTYARFRLTSDASVNGNTPNGAANNGEIEDYPVAIVPAPLYDYGDAPDASAGTGTGNYKTTAADGGAAQVVIDTAGRVLSIGNTIDFDDGSLQNSNADADDTSGSTPDDEDGVTFPTLTTTPGQTYTVTVTAKNNVPAVPAYLVGFIDFNKDGDFLDTGEQSNTVTISSDALGNNGELRTFNVTFTTPAGMTPGDTYARFRLGQIEATAQSATGASAGTDNGEIEDYKVAIAPASNYACPNAKADLWFANDESGSVDAAEFNNALDFLYQISDEFVYDDVTGIKAGVISWAQNTPQANPNNIIIPITETFSDPGDSGLISTGGVTINNNNEGIREQYDSRKDSSGGTRLDRATQYLAGLIGNNANGSRSDVPQIAVVLTDAYDYQITGTGGGNAWINAVNNLKNARPGTTIILVLIDAASSAYNNSTDNPGDVKDIVDRVVDNGRLLQVPTYLDAADATNDYIENVSQAICDVATTPIASDPNLLLVKRITAINPGRSDEIRFNSFVNDDSDDDGDFNNDPDNDPNWPPDGDDTYLPGATTVANIQPGDEVEYTIYFLSSGDEPATNVKICDVIPDNMSLVKDAYDVGAGVALGLNDTALPTEPNTTLSNAADTDDGTFYAPGTAPPTVGNPAVNLCQKVDTAGNTVSVGANENINGAIVVEIDSLPEATAPGTPANSYGFIRFRARVK